MTVVRIGIGQINTRVGDFEGNLSLILARIKEAGEKGVEILVFPEMAVTGYPMEDLAFRGSFIHASEQAIQTIAKSLTRSRMIVIAGGIETGDAFYNGAALIHKGKVLGWARKRYLFCCGRIDESRYFTASHRPLVIDTEKFKAVVTIGEDFGYPVFPAEVEILINLWNEPYHFGHRPLREQMMIERAKDDAVAIAMVNPVGGQDDMVFEGSSTVVDGFGEVLARGKAFAEDLVIADLDLRELKAHRARTFHSSRPEPHRLGKTYLVNIPGAWPKKKKPVKVPSRIEPLLKGPKEMLNALTLATGDFVRKNGFGKAVVGVSGGIDSALTALIAREALGKKGVIAVSMPGPYTSSETKKDAKKIAKNLGVKFFEIPINPAFKTLEKSLAPAFKGKKPDVTEENLQARIRGQILMSLSNKFSAIVLATGNKSEAACGYCTLYGDTAGGFSPLSDIYKTQVYEIVEWYNKRAGKDVVPRSIIERAPSAELSPGQKDLDSLPPYIDLDRILNGFLEEGLSIAEMVERSEEPEMVYSVMNMLIKAEFKRRLSPIGPAISEMPLSALKLPITSKTGWWLSKDKGSDAGRKKKAPQGRSKDKK